MVDESTGSSVSSPTYRLADTLLKGQFRPFVATRRAAGLSWRRIASELRDATENEVDVTDETLRVWFADLKEPAA